MADKLFVHSKIRDQAYDALDTVILVNAKQAAFYCSKNIPLLDLELSSDRKSGEPIFCYVFQRSMTKDVYDEWCNREHKNYRT